MPPSSLGSRCEENSATNAQRGQCIHNRSRLYRCILAAVSAAAVSLANDEWHCAHAGPIFSASATIDGQGEFREESHGVTASEEYFSSGFFGVSGNYLSASSFAKSDPGTVGASARTELFFPDFNQLGRIQKGAQGQASFRIDDLIFSSVEPSDATSVQNVSLNVHVDGSLSANAQKGHGIGSAFAQASVHLSGSLGIPFGTGFISFSGSSAVSDSADDADPFGRFSRAESGLFSGQSDGSFLFTSAAADLPLGTALLLSLELTTGAFSYADQHGTGGGLLHLRIAEAQSSFADTVSFPTSGPVFNLPDGFTVNSASGLIVDNRWVGGTQTSPVPEPSSVALLGTGLLSLAGCGLRRRQSAAQAA